MATADKKKTSLADIMGPEEQEALQTMMEMARQIFKGAPKKKANLVDFADALATQFRGADGFAARYMIEFLAADRGSPQRTQLLIKAADIWKESSKGNTELSIDDMTEDEIEREIQDIFLGTRGIDPGDPQTTEGKALAEAVLLEEDDEAVELNAELSRLEEAEQVDLLAHKIMEKKLGINPQQEERVGDEVE